MTVVSARIDQEAPAIPAPHVDRFQITSSNGILVRMSFAETLAAGETADYRAAVTMPAADARQLASTILNVLGTTSPDSA